MYDHHFGGANSRKKHQQIIRQVQHERMAQAINKPNGEQRAAIPQQVKRVALAVAQLLMK